MQYQFSKDSLGDRVEREKVFHEKRYVADDPRKVIHGIYRLAHQVNHLRLSIEAGWQILGIDFYTFGAPGNAIDSNTPIALQQFPQIKVWLFGAEGHGLFVLHHVLSIEENVGILLDLNEFIDRYENVSNQDVLTLQLHPNAWDDKGYQKFEQILDFLVDESRQFHAPFGYYTWFQDRDRITVTKTGNREYIFDFYNTLFSYRLEIVIEPLQFCVLPL